LAIAIKPSDLKFKYPRDVARRAEPKFKGTPDPAPFNRDDLYEIIPILEAVMDALPSTDGDVLNVLEDILNEMPRFVATREEVFGFLLGTARERFDL
jgi:hypothetical protein